jgi:hypothetical protein
VHVYVCALQWGGVGGVPAARGGVNTCVRVRYTMVND